jgi:hypothetical protein
MEAWLVSQIRDERAFYPGFVLPDCVGKFSGELLIVGTGRSVMEDLGKYQPRGDVLVIKQMGLFYPKFRHWWLSDTKDYPNWLKCVAETGRARDYRIAFATHGNSSCPGLDYTWQFNPRLARSAGLEAAIVSLALGYAPIVLAGCPADGTGHFFPDGNFIPGAQVIDYGDREHETAWKALSENVFKGRVKSLSGNTRKWLGEP